MSPSPSPPPSPSPSPSPPPTLDTIPHEILEHIAYFAATPHPPAPPSALPALLAANSALNAALAPAANPHLYARVFAATFDTAAPVRRLRGPDAHELTVAAFVPELQRRWAVLTRIRARRDCLLRSPPPCQDRDRDQEDADQEADAAADALPGILWVAYVMMLENDGKNEALLRHYARLHDWLLDYWFHPAGASCAHALIDTRRWPANGTPAALAMWLFWFLLKPGDYLHDEDVYRRVLCILKPLALGAHIYSLCDPSWVHFHPQRDARAPAPAVPHYHTTQALTPPPLAAPAILAYLSLANHQLALSSAHTTAALAPVTPLAPAAALAPGAPASLSEKWDCEWRRCLALGAAPYPVAHARAFAPGSIEGVWEGMFTYTEFTAYAALLSGAGPQILQKSLIAQHRHTWKLREHHLLADAPPVPPGDPLRGYLPLAAHVAEDAAGVTVHTPGHAPAFYHRHRAHDAARVRDVIITGEGHSAWGQFSLMGRVRPCDGFISVSKEYVEGDRGKWLYRGYLVGTTNGNLVGRWRDTLSPAEMHGYEGCFGMSRRR